MTMKELPEGWVDVRLGDFAKTEKGKKPKVLSKERTDACHIPYVNIKAFEKNVIDEYTDGVGCVICEDDDFLMVWDGSRSGYVGKAIKGALGSTLVRIKFPNVNHDYAYYFLQSKFLEINTRAKGVGIPHVDPNLVWNYRFPLPPLPVQQAIVAKIEEIFSELDKGVQQLETARQQLKVYRQSVLKWAFEGKLTNENVVDGELPEGWKWVKLGEVASLITKGASPKWQGINYVDDTSQVLFITSENVRENWIDISSPKYLESSFNQKQKRSILQKGDVLLNIVGASIGRASIYNLDFVANINQAVSVIRLKENVNEKFVCYFLNSNKAMSYYNFSKVDVARANLSLSDVSNIPIPLPPLSEQHRIVAEIERRLSVCEALEASIEQSLRSAEVLRQGVLGRAFSGRLVGS